MAWSGFLLLTAYGGVIYLIGVDQLLHLVGLGLLLSLMLQDPLLLSQHTHIPQKLSRGRNVKPYPGLQQEVFTRSLKFPAWFSTGVLLHMDAHELHHMYVQVPGFYLRRIDYVPTNEVHWRRWLAQAKRVPGEVFLFQNRTQSGLNI
jgi:fatty acid desaturase